MHIAICDDSVRDAEYLKELCCKTKLLNSEDIHVFHDSEKLLDIYKRGNSYDIVFLDVEMPKIDGIEIGKQIRSLDEKVIIIYVSGYPQYAIDAYDCEAMNYLIKPCQLERLKTILEKAFTRLKMQKQHHLVYVKKTAVRLDLSEIYYVECFKKHLFYHLKDKTIDVVGTISNAYEQLKDYGFYQVHQGYIVNFEKVKHFQDLSIILDDGRNVQISIRKKSEVLLAYTKYAERFL